MKTKTGRIGEDATVAVSEDKVRKSLQTLQPAAVTGKENLVGHGRALRSSAGKESLKESILEKAKPVLAKTTTKDVKGKPKGKQTVQAKSKEKIRKEDLTSEAGPSDNYWQRLAENLQRRLDGKIEENADLKEENKRQKRQINQMQRQLEEAKNIISTFEELLNEDSNGINNSLDDTC